MSVPASPLRPLNWTEILLFGLTCAWSWTAVHGAVVLLPFVGPFGFLMFFLAMPLALGSVAMSAFLQSLLLRGRAGAQWLSLTLAGATLGVPVATVAVWSAMGASAAVLKSPWLFAAVVHTVLGVTLGLAQGFAWRARLRNPFVVSSLVTLVAFAPASFLLTLGTLRLFDQVSLGNWLQGAALVGLSGLIGGGAKAWMLDKCLRMPRLLRKGPTELAAVDGAVEPLGDVDGAVPLASRGIVESRESGFSVLSAGQQFRFACASVVGWTAVNLALAGALVSAVFVVFTGPLLVCLAWFGIGSAASLQRRVLGDRVKSSWGWMAAAGGVLGLPFMALLWKTIPPAQGDWTYLAAAHLVGALALGALQGFAWKGAALGSVVRSVLVTVLAVAPASVLTCCAANGVRYGDVSLLAAAVVLGVSGLLGGYLKALLLNLGSSRAHGYGIERAT